MKKIAKIFTLSACIWAVYMLVLFIFLSLCVEFQWTFIYNLPAAVDWLMRNVLVLLFTAGRIGAPVLTGVAVILTVIDCVKQNSAKAADIPLLGTTLIFTVTASIIAAVDTAIMATFS